MIPPCRRCGSRDFDLRKHPHGKHGLQRVCIPCNRRRAREDWHKHAEKRRRADRERKREKRR